MENNQERFLTRNQQIHQHELKSYRVGESNIATDGSIMRIIEYDNANNISVEFQDEFQYHVHTTYRNFQKGHVSNPGLRIMYGRGYIGQGKYLPTYNKKSTKARDAWSRMFDRCYNPNYILLYPTYNEAEVCEEWYNFQNFAEWFYQNEYDVGDQSLEVDKDWLSVGNKLYCPEKCCLAPNIINTCILTHKKIKYLDLPVGVSPTASGRYKARCSYYGERKDLGTYNTIQEAEQAYWQFKIKYVEQLAQEYKNVIPNSLYMALMDFRNTYKERYKLDHEVII